jgi:hypothetical protein
MLGLPGMMVAAITEAERTSENAAAKTLFVVSALKNMGAIPFSNCSGEPFRRMPRTTQGPCQFRKMAEFWGFLNIRS